MGAGEVAAEGVRGSAADAWRKRGRARGGHVVGQCGGVASGGSGPAVARMGGVLPRDSGGRRGQRDAGRRG
jgi:hypothetical protein